MLHVPELQDTRRFCEEQIPISSLLCSLKIMSTNTHNPTKEISKPSLRKFVKAVHSHMDFIWRLGTFTELRDFSFALVTIHNTVSRYNGRFSHGNRENEIGNRISESEICWEDMVSHQCWIMEPNPHVLATVTTAFNQGGHKGSFSSTEHRHKVSWWPLLAGQLGKRDRMSDILKLH